MLNHLKSALKMTTLVPKNLAEEHKNTRNAVLRIHLQLNHFTRQLFKLYCKDYFLFLNKYQIHFILRKDFLDDSSC